MRNGESRVKHAVDDMCHSLNFVAAGFVQWLADNPPILHDSQDAFRNPWIQGREHIKPPSPLLHINGVIKTNQNRFANIFLGLKLTDFGIIRMS
jgi:hypothetical protein